MRLFKDCMLTRSLVFWLFFTRLGNIGNDYHIMVRLGCLHCRTVRVDLFQCIGPKFTLFQIFNGVYTMRIYCDLKLFHWPSFQRCEVGIVRSESGRMRSAAGIVKI